MRRRKLIVWTIVALALAGITVLSWQSVLLRMPEGVLTAHLSHATPIGSTEEEVIAYANRSGCEADGPYRNELLPNSSYPKNRSGGSSWAKCVMGEYGLIFETAVEVFYIFDENGRLKEITIRKTTSLF